MLTLKTIYDNPQRVIDGLRKRNFDAEGMINEVLSLDEKRRNTQTQLDNTLAEVNSTSKLIGAFIKEGKKEEAEKSRLSVTTLKEESKVLESDLADAETKLQQILVNIPNVPHTSVPEGKGADDNLIERTGGSMPTLPEGAVPHWDLAKQYDLIDFELGVKIAGAGFPVYKGKGARLQRALINFFLDHATAAGYREMQVPHLVNAASGFGTGQLPDKEGQMYHSTVDDLYLIPTAEVPVTNLYRDVILKEEDLPIKNTAYTPCFRREAGSYGAHVRGLNRLHQFDKVEVVQVTHPDQSYQTLEDMNNYVQSLLKELGLHYRVLRLCGGDMGFTSAMTYDMEVWSAAQERWLEVSSVSNFETYQSNRLKLRFKGTSGKTQLAHTLNGSALALPRIVASILENYQTENGIVIPEVLRKYTGFDMID